MGRIPATFENQATGLSDWSIYSLGYSSQLMPDLRGIWSGDPGIETLANYLDSRAAQHPLSRYKALALIAHHGRPGSAKGARRLCPPAEAG